ncbi:hypothetical protein [Bradyrhizobium sp. NAS80.1]|uniref:hypothetical protein n=1 Tax=Bradyrhizobium sp. NAS80.1 TaxID=1680159 RepID=UPI001FD8B711|nr:hypothetical protein [Bradyrhizobium sp. NAS80.1]
MQRFNHPLTVAIHDTARVGVFAMSLIWMAQRGSRATVGGDEGVLSFPSPAPDKGATALDLVHQAADVFRDMEKRARETEARAHSLCTSALERLRLAEARAEAAERAQHEFTVTTERKLQDACRALEQAQCCIEAQKDKLTAVELRAEVAETEARQAKEALALVEEAIRKRLLCANPRADGRLATVA